jgi:MFS transporter, DHA1 family, inner membrane transport protein
MVKTTTSNVGAGHVGVSALLFLSLFAAQAALIAMAPVLADVASDLDVSTAAAGQLRTITGLVAGTTALMLGAVAGRFGLGRQLLVGSMLVALGSLASAAAPSFELLALAQVPVGVGVAALTTAATLAAAEWVSAEHRTRALSWALIGQPAAWIVGMPLIGLVGERSWRFGWLALPLAAALAAGVFAAARAGQPPARLAPVGARAVFAQRALGRWLASELLANAAWAGTLVYAGAVLAESYGVTSALTGSLLAVVAGAYVAGNLAGRRLVRLEPQRLLVLLAIALAVADTLFGAARWGVAVSTAILSSAAFAAGARTLIASAFALAAAPELRPALTSLRAATMQFGYFAGSILGGAALSVGGYGALGAVMGLLFLGAAATLVRSGPPLRAAVGRDAAAASRAQLALCQAGG